MSPKKYEVCYMRVSSNGSWSVWLIKQVNIWLSSRLCIVTEVTIKGLREDCTNHL